MLFLPLAEIDRNANPTSHDYCKKVPFGFRLLFTVSLLMLLLNQTAVPNLGMANIPSRTFPQFEFWRIFTAPLACLEGLVGSVGLLIAFWWLLSLFPYYVRTL